MSATPSGLTLGPGGSSGSLFASPALRNAIAGPIAPSQALLAPRAVADTGLAPSPEAPAATFAAARPEITPKAQSKARDAQTATPLGGLLSSLADALVTKPQQAFRRGFLDDADVDTLTNQLTQQALDSLPVPVEELDAETVSQIQADAAKEAKAQVNAQQNQEAFGAVVGQALIDNAARAGIALNAMDNAIDAQVKQMQRDTTRFINGVQFNSRLRAQASNIVQMRQNLRIIDSILTQAEPGLAGQQRQQFIRNPILGTRV